MTDITAFLKPLELGPAKLSQLAIEFSKVFNDLAWTSDEQFLPTPITLPKSIPFEGYVLSIDVGGTHFRVGLFHSQNGHIKLCFGGGYQVIPPAAKAGTAEDLFSWIGRSIVDLLIAFRSQRDPNSDSGPRLDDGLTCQQLPLGITFSFPMTQKTISKAVLMPLGKGFTFKSGQRLEELLVAHYEEERALCSSLDQTVLPQLVVKAILNDTAATMLAGTQLTTSMDDHENDAVDTSSSPAEAVMGLILATGTNATVSLPLTALGPLKRAVLDDTDSTADEILVNTEWSIRGTAAPMKTLKMITSWDKALDAGTTAPGFQPLEYMTSGRYMGELVRLVYIDYLVNIRHCSIESLPSRLVQPYAITTEYLSIVVAVTTKMPKRLAEELNTDIPAPATSSWTWTAENAEILAAIATKVQIRSSRLIAAAVIGLLACAGKVEWKSSNPLIQVSDYLSDNRDLVIAYAGAVINKYPNYLATCQEALDALFFSLCKNNNGVERLCLRHVNEGGLRGAALLAATETAA